MDIYDFEVELKDRPLLAKVQATTPHGSYVFDVVKVEKQKDGIVMLRLEPIE